MERNAKGLQAKARKCVVTVQRIGWSVKSPSGGSYWVREDRGTFICSCEWARWNDTRLRPCSHVLAVEEWCAGLNDRLSYWSEDVDAKRQHRPITQVGVGLLATHRRVSV
jgi:hypothetical protein